MKKIININLSGRVVPIEDSAYESLQRYIESLRRYFAKEEGRDEIINDIESRIAELMNDKIKKGAHAITDADVDEIIQSMGRIEDFEEVDAADNISSGGTGSSQSQSFTEKRSRGRLYRDSSDKLLGGVCSGIANYLDVDPAVIRILLVLFGFTGMGVLLYILLWIFLPARDLNDYVGKRLFRNPEDKVIAGVAGGLAAYLNKPSWTIRLILVAPLLFNIIFGTFNGIFFSWHRDFFPNVFVAPFTGTFVLAYIILWMVLPEARSSFEKMEMRGEKVDVNRIRQNVKSEMENLKTRTQAWTEEVKTSAENLSSRAREFANTRGKAFAGEVSQAARPAAAGIVHFIGVIFKAFFIFVAGCIALSLFAVLIAIVFGGVATWPVNDFLWSSGWQKFLAWGTVLFFFAVPVVAFITWLIRRIIRVRHRNRNLSWIFGGLWALGWLCAILFGISVGKDLREYQKTEQEVPLAQPANGTLLVRVNEPEIRYSNSIWWIHADNTGWDINENEMKYNNVKVRVTKSEDSLYHARLLKFSAGQSVTDAKNRASQIGFTAVSQDSVLNLASGITINRDSKFRGQGLILEISVPVGKRVRFDGSLVDAYNPWVVRRSENNAYGRYWGRRNSYKYDWDEDDYFDWKPDVTYVMTTDGKLVEPDQIIRDRKGTFEKQTNRDSLRRVIEERERQNEQDRQRLDRMEDSVGNSESTTQKNLRKPQRETAFILNPFAPLII